MGTVDLKAKFKTRSHELNVSTHSMIVLALFEGLEEDEKLSYVVGLLASRDLLCPTRAHMDD